MDGHLALYRTWRPRRFADVVGQAHVTRSLCRAVAQGRVAHAYLFCGPRGTGKTSVARILAQAILCRAPEDGEPCGVCETCRAARFDRLLAIEEIDAASHRGIDDVRALRERVTLAPGEGGARVHIVDEVHMLTPEAFNALLKTLEEPPPHVYFVLATTEPRKVPATIASRCQRFDFHRLSEAQIAARLREIAESLGAAVDDDAILAIAQRAEGGLRDAIGVLDQCLVYAEGRLSAKDVATVFGTATREELAALADAIAEGRAGDAWRIVGELYESGRDLAQVTRDLLGLWRRIWAEAADADARRRELEVIERLLSLEGELRRGAPTRVTVEAALAAAALARARPSGAAAGGGRTAAPERPQDRPEKSAPIRPREQSLVPSSEEPAPGERPGAPPGTSLALAELKAAWDEIVAAEDPPTRAILRECAPARVEGGVVTLDFRHEFHLEEARRRGYLKRLAGTLRQRTGLEIEVQARLAANDAPKGPEGAPAAPPTDPAAALAGLPPDAREKVLRVVERIGPPAWIEVAGDEGDEAAPRPAERPAGTGEDARQKGARR